jgi:hypothetical protein
MQRRVLWIAGAAIAVAAAAFVLRGLGRHEAGKVVDQDIQQALAGLPPGYTATHGATDVNPLTGTATLHDVTLSHDGQKLWQADSITIAGANQDALRDVFDPSAYPGGHPASQASHALVQDLAASGLHVPDPRDPDTVIDIRAVTLHGLSGRQFFAAPSAEQMRGKPFAADAALAFTAQSLDVRDVAIRNAKNSSTLSLGSFTLHDYASGKIGRLAAGGLSLDVTNTKPKPSHVHTALQSADLKDIDLGPVLRAVRDNATVSPANTTASSGGSLHLAGFALDVLPGPSITMDSASASGTAADASGLRTGKVAIDGLTISLKDTPLGQPGEALVQAFGMNAVTMDISAVAATDVPANHTKLEEKVDLHDLGSLHLNLSAGMANPLLVQKDARAALMSATIDHGALEWVDKGLVNRAFAAAASQMHVSADMVRAQLAIPLVSLGFFLPDQPDAVDQVTRFLNKPGTISVTLSPPAPFTLAAVSALSADQRAHAMGVHIEAK